MISSSLMGVVAQRLMRKVCPYCSAEEDPTAEEAELLGPFVPRVRRAKGCNMCNNTGYRGRTAIHEMVLIDDQIRKMITNHTSMEEIAEYAVREQGMKTLKESAVERVKLGITTVDELLKVAYYS